MYVTADSEFTATLLSPGGLGHLRLGARIEVPVTRAIVGYWRPAHLSGSIWQVELQAPPLAPAGGSGTDPALSCALAAGEFQLVWMDDAPTPAVEIFVPLHTYTGSGAGIGDTLVDWPEPDLEEIRPSVDDVALLVRTRTYTEGVVEHAELTDETRPPVEEVQRLIDQSVPVVLMQLRPRFPEAVYGQVSYAIALYTAIIIEGSYFREQLTESQVALYRDLYNQLITGIGTFIENELLAAGRKALRLV